MHGFAQAWEASRSGKDSEEETVGSQCAPDQRECSGKIVDAVKDADRNHHVEASFAEGQAILIALDAALGAGEQITGIGGGDLNAAAAKLACKQCISATEDKRGLEVPLDEVQPPEQFLSRFTVEVVRSGEHWGGTIPAEAAQAAVKRLVCVHEGLVPPALAEDKPGLCSR